MHTPNISDTTVIGLASGTLTPPAGVSNFNPLGADAPTDGNPISNPAALAGSLVALKQICEDCLEKYFMEGPAEKIEPLLGSVLALLSHPQVIHDPITSLYCQVPMRHGTTLRLALLTRRWAIKICPCHAPCPMPYACLPN